MGSQHRELDLGIVRDAIRKLPSRLVGPIQSRVDASDLAQEVTLQLLTQNEKPETINNAYLVKMARGHESKLRRHHNQKCRSVDREVRSPVDPADPGTVDSVIDERERLAWLADQIGKLPDDEEIAICDRAFDGLSYAEMARRRGQSEHYWRLAYRRATEILRQRARECGINYGEE